MKVTYLVSLAVLLLPLFAAAQTSGARELHQVTPSQLTTFTSADGLPICVGGTFMTPGGRIYVTSCGQGQAEENVFLYEFDGYHVRKIPFHQILGNKNVIPIFSGINSEGELYGLFNWKGEKNKSIFTFHPETYRLKCFSMEGVLPQEADILKIIFQPDFGYTIFAADTANNYLFDFRESKFHHITTFPKGDYALNYRNPMLIRQRQAIWLCEGSGAFLWRYEVATKRVKKFDCHDYSGSNDPKTSFAHIFMDNDENVFACLTHSDESGFLKYTGTEFIHFLKPHNTIRNPFTYEFGAFFADKMGNILVGAADYPRGFFQLLLFEKGTGKIYDYSPVYKAVQAAVHQPRDVITGIQGTDFRRGALFTAWGGICFAEIRSVEALKAYPTGGTRGMAELNADRLLIKAEGSRSGFELNTKNGELIRLIRFPCKNNTPISLADIQRDARGIVYLSAGMEGKLLCYNSHINECSEIAVGIPFIRFTFLNDRQLAMVHKGTSELYYFDLLDRHLEQAMYNGQPVRFKSTVLHLKLTVDSLLWVGTNNGLWKVNVQTNEFSRPYPALPFQQDQVYCIEEGDNEELWLGTGSGGLQLFTPLNGDLRIIDKSLGLSNNTVVGILKDNQGIRWINTYNGLNLISATGEFLTKLYESDGLANNEGNRFSSLKLSDGRLAFGSIQGTTMIQPELAKQQFVTGDSLNIFLTQVRYFDKKLWKDSIQNHDLDHHISLNIPATNRYLNLRFSLSDFRRVQENSFAYRFEWDDQKEPSDWYFLGNRPELNLTNLQAGHYDIVIRGINFRGQQTVAPIRVSLDVNEFFYKTTWFLVLVFLFLSAIPILWLIRERFEKKRLQRLVQLRTAEIVKDKEVIEAQAEQLQSLDQAKSRFFTNISHELRTPLTVIAGMAERISGPERIKELIQRNTGHLLELINQILDLRKLESGSLPAQLIQGDVVKYMRYILESFHSIADDKNIRLLFESREVSILLDYDPEKLLRIVSNLLSNALKFTSEGGTVKLALSAPEAADVPYYRFSVSDTGIGIPSEQITRIFDRFYQADDEKSRVGEGTGIGLTLTKELIELLNGSIQVESRVGQGTTFTVRLPMTRLAERAEHIAEAVPAVPLAGASSIPERLMAQHAENTKDLPALLIVEDNPDVMEYLTTCVDETFRLSFASDGLEGIEKAIEEIPDIIISDVMMPRANGFELCNTLKADERTSHIPIVLLTAKADVESRIEGIKRGADAYLAKPFNQDELTAVLQNLLNIRKQLQEKYAQLTLSPEEVQSPGIQIENAFLQKIRDVVEERLSDADFSMPQLERTIGMSQSQFYRKVKALTGKSPSVFVRSVRLQHGKHLLETTEMNVTEVAYEVGFSSQSYFSTAFMEEFGIQPGNLKK